MDAIAKAMEIATPAAAALPLIAGAQEAEAENSALQQSQPSKSKHSEKNKKDDSTKFYGALDVSASETAPIFPGSQLSVSLGGGLEIPTPQFLNYESFEGFDTVNLELVLPYSNENFTHTTELGFELSAGVSKNMPTGLDRLMRQFAEGLKYGIDLKLGSRNFYDSFRPFKSLTPDLMNMWYTQLGLAGGWGNERFQSLVYIDIPLILDDLGQWNENTGSGRRGNYGKLNVGGDLLFKILKNEEIKDEDMDLSFHVAVDYQQEVLNKMIQHDLLKVKLGPYSNFNENNEDIFKAAALYLTLNNLKVKGLGQLKNYQEDT
ncbi:hypothetical protein DRJ22_03785, partial [Candidatus Woesearchaeota archaeon]